MGDRARWIGDNWNDPAIPGPIQASTPTPFTAIYYDHMVEMRHKPQTQAQLIAQLRGNAVSGTNHSLTVEDQDWWNEFWYPKGAGRVETGTFTGGSTTGGTDSTKGASYEIVGYDEETFEPIYGWVPTEEGCWWSMSRFLFDGSASAYEYFIIEVLISGVWHKRVIRATTQDDGGVTVSWNEPLPASANGKQYRIREAIGYVVNRFRGRTLTLTEPDGETTHEVTIIANDDKSLFWDAA